MIIELASGRKQKYVSVSAYKRNRNVSAHTRNYPNLSEKKSAHIYIPAHLNNGSGVFVREDHLDYLNDNDWNQLMDSVIDYQPALAELSGKAKKEAKAEKKAARTERKNNKGASKNDKRTAKGDKKRDKGSAKKTRANAKQTRANAKQDKANNPNRKSASEIFDSVVDKASDVYDKFKGGGRNDDDSRASGGSGRSGGSGGSDNSDAEGNESQDGKIFGLPKMVVYGGATVLGLGLIALVVKSKK